MNSTAIKTPLFLLMRIAALFLGALAVPVIAQEAVDEPADIPEVVADEFDRGTPMRSGDGFIAAVEKGDYETAAEYLDLRNLRGDATELTGEQLARRLYIVIQRANWVDVDELVDHPEGRRTDSLPGYRDSIGVVLDEGKELRLLMQKVPRSDGVFIWKISNATVSLVPELYEEYGYPEIVEKVRRSVPKVIFLGFELFKWVIVEGFRSQSFTPVFFSLSLRGRT